MKKVFLAGLTAVLFLGSCGESADSDALTGALTDASDVQEAVKSFADGGATNGEEYFSGILAAVVDVDVKLREVMRMDEMDSPEDKINDVLDSTLAKIDAGRNAINVYKSESWPKRAEFHTLTMEWFATVENLVNDYLIDLAEPMSRADDTWSQEELDFYDEYLVAYEAYLEVDGRWVDFQYVYAAANGFTIEGTIDEEAMVDEELSAAE